MQAAVQQAVESPVDDLSEAELIDRIAQIETLTNSLEALQGATVYSFARAHAASKTATGRVEPEKLERDIAGQISPACRVSVHEARKRVRMARDLRDGLGHVRRLFTAGELSAHKVATIVTATADLDTAERAEVDRLLGTRPLERLGVGQIRGLARQLAAQVAPDKFRARCAAARTNRRITLRPAADGMTDLIAHLPAEQGVACYAALQKAVNDVSVSPAPMTRSRGQVMADTLVERITGQATADSVGIDVQVVVPVEALVDPKSPLPAQIPGHGPVPLDLLATAKGRKTWRRLVSRRGIVLGGDSRRRTFTGQLADLIKARDGHRCSEPFCDSPIRHVDHIQRWSDGGRTEFDNGRGLCEFHNYLRENPGWNVERTPRGVRSTTPTGHSYVNPAVRWVAGEC